MGRYAFLRGEFVPLKDANVNVMTHAFMYGTGCFEGIRGYWSEKEGEMFLFRLREHYERLLGSCRILRIEPGYTIDELCDLTVELVRRKGDREDVYVRPMFYKAAQTIGVKLTGLEDDLVMVSVPFGPYLDVDKGLRVRVSS